MYIDLSHSYHALVQVALQLMLVGICGYIRGFSPFFFNFHFLKFYSHILVGCKSKVPILFLSDNLINYVIFELGIFSLTVTKNETFLFIQL